MDKDAASQTTLGDNRALADTWYTRGARDERERCAKIAENAIKIRGGVEWALDEEHNDACRQIAREIRNG